MKTFDGLIFLLSLAAPALAGCGETSLGGGAIPDGSGGAGGAAATTSSTAASDTSSSSSTTQTSSSTSAAGTGGGAPGSSAPLCSGVIEGAAPERQPVWARCFAPFATAFAVDSDGTVAVLRPTTDSLFLFDANGGDLGSLPVSPPVTVGWQIEGAEMAFAPSTSGGPSDLLVDYIRDKLTGPPSQGILERYDRTGTRLWRVTAEDSLSSAGNVVSTIAVDSSGGATLALTSASAPSNCRATRVDALGASSWTVSVEPGSPCYDAAVDTSGDTFVATASADLVKIDPAGTLLWSTSLGHFANPTIIGMGTDSSGTSTVGVWDFAGINPSPMTLVRVATDGSIAASTTFDVTSVVRFDLTVDASGDTYLTGVTKAGTTIGSFVVGGSVAPVMIAKFDPALTPLWVTTIPDSMGQELGAAVVRVDAAGDPYLWVLDTSETFDAVVKLPP
jgi:hypothetical protein